MNIEEKLKNLDQMEVQTEKKKETRGRHKLTCECEKCQAKRAAKKAAEEQPEPEPTQATEPKPYATPEATTSIESEFDSAINLFNSKIPDEPEEAEDTEQEEEPDRPSNAAQISGYMMLTIIDLFIPFLIVKLVSMFSPKYKGVDISKIRLDNEEKKDLEEIADAVASEYVNMSPATLLVVCLASIYYAKINAEVQLNNIK